MVQRLPWYSTCPHQPPWCGGVVARVTDEMATRMVRATIGGEDAWYSRDYLQELATLGSEDALAALDPEYAASKKAYEDENAAQRAARQLAQVAARRTALNSPPPGFNVAPMSAGAIDGGFLEPIMEHLNDFVLSCALTLVCREWCSAVHTWRQSVTELRLLKHVNEQRLGDAGVAALTRYCPQLSQLAVWIGGTHKGFEDSPSHQLTMRGVESMASLHNLRSLTLVSTEGLLSAPQAVGAMHALGSHKKLERISLPMLEHGALLAFATAAAETNTTDGMVSSLRHVQVGTIGKTLSPDVVEDRNTVVALANIPALRSIDLVCGANLNTNDMRFLATSLTRTLTLLRIRVLGVRKVVESLWSPTEVLSLLAEHCPLLVHIKLESRGGNHLSAIRIHEDVPYQLPPATAETWHQHIPDDASSFYGDLKRVACKFPTAAAIEAETLQIANALVKLSSLAFLQHLELPGLQQYRKLTTFMPDSPDMDLEQDFLEEMPQRAQFPALQHLDVSDWDCVDTLSMIRLLQAAPRLRTVAARNCNGIAADLVRGLMGFYDPEGAAVAEGEEQGAVPWPRCCKPAGLRILDATGWSHDAEEILEGAGADAELPPYLYRDLPESCDPYSWLPYLERWVRNPSPDDLDFVFRKTVRISACMCDSCSAFRHETPSTAFPDWPCVYMHGDALSFTGDF